MRSELRLTKIIEHTDCEEHWLAQPLLLELSDA
ncbi:hypothetical protein J2T05_004241 [Cupriavidus necator]|nr:hypothetical protein [Cupriavidus necator]